MAGLSRTVRVRFDGDVRGLSAAAKRAEKDLNRLQGQARSFSTGFAAAGAAAGLGAAAIGAALPALGSLALQFGVVKLAMKANNVESKEFKKQLEAMKKPLQDLSNTAGKAFLPGVTKFLKDSTTLFPLLNGAVERTGKIMGDTASRLGDLFKTEKFKSDLDGFFRSTEPVTRAIGDSLVKLTGKLVEFGAKMAPVGEGFARFIDGATRGISGLLDGLAPHADSFKRIFESLGSIVGNVLPLIGQFAGAMADRLAPILEKVAGFIDRNKAAISQWIPFLADAAVALGALVVGSKVVGWLSGVASAISGIGTAAGGAHGKVGTLVTKLGGLKTLGGAAAIAGIAVAMDQVNVSAAGGAQNLQGFEENLHDIVGAAQQVLSGDIGGIFADINRQLDEVNTKWSEGRAPIQQWAAQVGTSAQQANRDIENFFRSLVGMPPLPPIPVGVDTAPGQAGVNQFVGGVSRTRGTLQIDGDIDPVTGKVKQSVKFADGSTGTITVDGNKIPSDGKVTGAVKFANGSKGTITIDGNQTPANGKINATVTYGNGRRATIQVDASTSAANSRIAGLVQNWNGRRINLIVTSTGSGGIASAGRLATGGPINGPGTGTSDTAGLFALSKGEHVFTAAEVRAMGGQQAVMAFRRGLVGGSPSRFASTSGSATGGSVGTQSSGTPIVVVNIDGQEFRGMIRTEISESNRQTRRLVGSGAYRGV